VFCVGAFLAAEPHWRAIQEQWTVRLAFDNIAYFRATDCKAVKGPFYNLRGKCGSLTLAMQAAADIRTDLEQILLAAHWIGFGLGIVIRDYNHVLKQIPETGFFFAKDHTVAAYSEMMYEVARSVRKNAPGHTVSFVIDASSCSAKITDALRAIKIIHSTIGTSIDTVTALDDKTHPPLQVADLISNIVKDSFLEWLKQGKPKYVPLDAKWLNHFQAIGTWDEAHMLHSFTKTLTSTRFGKGLLPSPPQPEMTKAQRKRMRREMVRTRLGSKPTGK
jgi:hypothetical protein